MLFVIFTVILACIITSIIIFKKFKGESIGREIKLFLSYIVLAASISAGMMSIFILGVAHALTF